MTFLEQLTGQKRKHSLDRGDASSVEEDFDISNAFGDKPTPNSGVGTRVDNDQLTWDFGSPTEMEQSSSNLNSPASVDWVDDYAVHTLEGVGEVDWEDNDSLHTLEGVGEVDWKDNDSLHTLEGVGEVDWEDGTETALSQYPKVSSSASAAEYSDAERRQQLLKWRSQFVKPHEKVKLYAEFRLPGKTVPLIEIDDKKLVTRVVRDDIDILIYNLGGKKPVFLCDFCGKYYIDKRNLVRHIKDTHGGLQKLYDQEHRQQLLEWRRKFVKPGERLKLYTDIKLPDKNKFPNFPADPSLVTRTVRPDIDILVYNPVDGEPVFLCDFCGRPYQLTASIHRHIKYEHKLVKCLSDQERRQQLLEWRRQFVKPNEKVKLYADIKLSIRNTFPNFPADPSLVTRTVRPDIDILVYNLEGEKPVFLCDFCGSKFRSKGEIKKHIELNHNAVKRTDQENRQKLLEWRRQFVDPDKKAKLYTDIMLPVTFKFEKFTADPEHVTREVLNPIDILKYNPVGGDPSFLCDFCGRPYRSRNIIIKHFKESHKVDPRLLRQDVRQKKTRMVPSNS